MRNELPESPVKMKKIERMFDKGAYGAVGQLCFLIENNKSEIPGKITEVTEQFPKVFEVPKGLPPPRLHEHNIPMTKEIQSFRIRPYKRSFIQQFQRISETSIMFLDAENSAPSISIPIPISISLDSIWFWSTPKLYGITGLTKKIVTNEAHVILHYLLNPRVMKRTRQLNSCKEDIQALNLEDKVNLRGMDVMGWTIYYLVGLVLLWTSPSPLLF